jgi:SNF2 family DNA or RNA helicase
LLGCETEFRKEFSKNIAQGQSRDATERQRSQGARASDELRRLCRPFMLRREKNAVLAKASTEQETAGGGSPVSDGKTREASATPQKVPPSPSSGPATSIEASTTGWAGVKHAPSQLGTKNDLVVWIPLAPAQRRLYRAFLESSTVRAVLNKTGSALAAINVLKKICDHPSLCVAVAEDGNKAVSAETEVDETPQGETPRTDKHESEVMDDTEHTESKREAVLSAIASAGLSKRDLEGDAAASGKAQFLRSLLRELTKNGHRTLVFSQSRKMLDVIEKFANQDGHALVRIDGNVPAEERHNRVERFQNVANDIPLALLTTQVGGLGLTLTAADRVVIYDPSWNPAADSQSVDRAYRIGQTRDVVVYRCVFPDPNPGDCLRIQD